MSAATLITPRDWQMIAMTKAMDALGTPEGADLLVESKRYGVLADHIDKLEHQAAQDRALIEQLRADLGEVQSKFADACAELAALRAQEPAYYVIVSGRMYLTDPTAYGLSLPDGRHALYAAPQPAAAPADTDTRSA